MSEARTRERGPGLRIRRSEERSFEDFGWTDNWSTFSFAEHDDAEWVHFGPLRVMVENQTQPRSGFPAHPHRDVEIVTYVATETLERGDGAGITEAGRLELAFEADSEVLLFDVRMDAPMIWK